jgi:N-acetylornithine carbamoyltransferase
MESLKGKHLITTMDWELDDLIKIIEVAEDMQKNRYADKYTKLLAYKTFLMFFYNPSVRTRQSFEAAATELGGHAQFLEPKSMRLKTAKSAGETVEDAANVMSRYGVGLGIRILEGKISAYGDGEKLLREYAKYSKIPIISMAHDKYHPMQGLADVMGLRKHLGKNLEGKTFTLTWGKGALARSWCSVQEALVLYSRFGMNVRIARPDGYDLDPEVIEYTKKQCEKNGKEFFITGDQEEAYDGSNIIYSRNWMSPNAYHDGEYHKEEEIEKSLQHQNWICDGRKMRLTDNGIYIHPMPVDRGNEVTDEVASSPRSIIYDVAENRLHVQKATMALTMSDLEV